MFMNSKIANGFAESKARTTGAAQASTPNRQAFGPGSAADSYASASNSAHGGRSGPSPQAPQSTSSDAHAAPPRGKEPVVTLSEQLRQTHVHLGGLTGELFQEAISAARYVRLLWQKPAETLTQIETSFSDMGSQVLKVLADNTKRLRAAESRLEAARETCGFGDPIILRCREDVVATRKENEDALNAQGSEVFSVITMMRGLHSGQIDARVKEGEGRLDAAQKALVMLQTAIEGIEPAHRMQLEALTKEFERAIQQADQIFTQRMAERKQMSAEEQQKHKQAMDWQDKSLAKYIAESEATLKRLQIEFQRDLETLKENNAEADQVRKHQLACDQASRDHHFRMDVQKTEREKNAADARAREQSDGLFGAIEKVIKGFLPLLGPLLA